MNYRLLPAHRRKLRQMRALVDSGTAAADAHAAAVTYLAVHASCEAFLAAREIGEWPAERPRCASGLGKNTRGKAPVVAGAAVKSCAVCKKQKSVLSFDEESGMCIKCKYKIEDATKGKQPRSPRPAPTKRRKCPVCVQAVTVKLVLDEWVVTEHKKARGDGLVECQGAGKVVSHERRDALDHTVPGSFEGGRRR